MVAAELNTEGGREYVTYKIRVSDGVEGAQWTVARRFRNFEELHRVLRGNPAYKLKLPPKRVFFHNQVCLYVVDTCNHACVHRRWISLRSGVRSWTSTSPRSCWTTTWQVRGVTTRRSCSTAQAGAEEVHDFLSLSSLVFETEGEAGFLSKVGHDGYVACCTQPPCLQYR